MRKGSVFLPCSSCLNLATIQMCISNVPRQGCTGELLRKNLITRIPRFCCTKFKNRFLSTCLSDSTDSNSSLQVEINRTVNLSSYSLYLLLGQNQQVTWSRTSGNLLTFLYQVPKVPILWAMF